MKLRTAQAATAVLALLLVALVAVGLVVRGRAESGQAADQAQASIAAELTSLQARVQGSGLAQDQRTALSHRLDQELALLDDDATASATAAASASSSASAASDSASLSTAYQKAAQHVFAQARNHAADAKTAAVYADIAVGLWVSDVVRTGQASDLSSGSAARTSLAAVLGTGTGTELAPKGVCPGDDAPKGSTASQPLASVAEELDRTVWAEQAWSARATTGSSEQALVDHALSVDQDRSTALDSGISSCGSLPATKSAYRLPSGSTAQALGRQEQSLASEDLDLLGEQSLAETGTRTTGLWAAQDLALHSALQAQATGAVPALPGR